MADKKKMSIEDILAACRTGEGASSPSSEGAAEKPAPTEAAKEKPAAKSPPTSAKSDAGAAKGSGPLSVADILAAARGGSGTSAEPAAKKEPAAPKDAGAKPASAKPAGGGTAAGKGSVADILAAARGGGAGAAPAAKPTPKPKPATEAKPTAAKADAPSAGGPMDTSSILAALRKPTKPGPVSKAEASAAATAAMAKPKSGALPMPEKPAYASAKAAAIKTDRRGLLSVFFGSFLAVGFTTMGLTTGLGVLGLLRFLFPNVLIEPPSRFRVGFPNDFAPGSVSDKFKAQFGIWVVNAEYEGLQQIVALKTVCTHLGCTPNWLEAEQKFKCPCHGSGFYKDGVNFEGPAPRPLERYAIQIASDGQLEIDKSKTFQQEMGQWSDPACFVPV